MPIAVGSSGEDQEHQEDDIVPRRHWRQSFIGATGYTSGDRPQGVPEVLATQDGDWRGAERWPP